MKHSNDQLKQAFDKYISNSDLKKVEDKERFNRWLQQKKSRKSRAEWFPRVLTLVLFIGLAALLYSVFSSNYIGTDKQVNSSINKFLTDSEDKYNILIVYDGMNEKNSEIASAINDISNSTNTEKHFIYYSYEHKDLKKLDLHQPSFVVFDNEKQLLKTTKINEVIQFFERHSPVKKQNSSGEVNFTTEDNLVNDYLEKYDLTTISMIKSFTSEGAGNGIETHYKIYKENKQLN